MKLYMCEKPNQAGDLARNLNITGSNDVTFLPPIKLTALKSWVTKV
jgi:hypothetical protein